MKTNATPQDLIQALRITNNIFSGNIVFTLYPAVKGSHTHFGLQVSKADQPGASHDPKIMGSVCWHVLGHFFNALFVVNPDCHIHTALGKFSREFGTWSSSPIGAVFNTELYRDLCGCKGKLLDVNLVYKN